MAPLGHAMSFVDRNKVDTPLSEFIEKRGDHEPFGCDVKKPVFSAEEACETLARKLLADGGV